MFSQIYNIHQYCVLIKCSIFRLNLQCISAERNLREHFTFKVNLLDPENALLHLW